MKIYADPTYQVQISNTAGQEANYKVGKIQTNDEQSSSGVIDAFIDAIQSKKAPLISGEDGYKGLQVVLAAIQSSETGRTVVI
jgi:predicted dehydrogenase